MLVAQNGVQKVVLDLMEMEEYLSMEWSALGGMTVRECMNHISKEKCRMIVMNDEHPNWPERSQDNGQGGGAVVPLTDEDLSMGLTSDLTHFLVEFTG